jgi:cyclopropane fatty-acyl-phospholipid synthase-like methyltransferase
MSAETDFAIAVELLSDTRAPLPWSNLGDWSAALHYDDACRALARRVGHAAALQADDHVLDLACGHGASLAHWPEAFGVRCVSGLEIRSACVTQIRAHAPAGLEAIEAGRFDTWPAPGALREQTFDAVVCVDAAYHASSLAAFASFSAALLKPQGRFAFTTLVAAESLDETRALPMRLVLARAGIPPASVPTTEVLASTLAGQGFAEIRIQALDTEVLQGFHDFVQRRRGELSWRQKAGAGWLKIEATAWLCGRLVASGALHYCLVSATRAD